MPNKFFKLPVAPWRLLLALLLSLLLHAWMIGGLDGWLLSDEPAPPDPLRIELTPVHPVPRPPLPKKSIPPAPAAAPRVPAEVVTAPATPPPAQAAVSPATPSAAVEAPAEVTPKAAEEAPKLPVAVTIEFQVVRNGSVAGTEHHSYQARGDGGYTLTSLAEARGLLALALSDLRQKSEGRITSHGLRPDSYLYQYGTKASRAQKASFDWQGHVLGLDVGSNHQSVELPEDTQDLMSFMYQFMFVPPLQQMQLTVTNGKMLRVYNYAFEGEETLTSKMGPLRTLRIGKSDGDEKTEIWLAADQHYLPVKISKTEKDGTVMERIATRLQIDYDTTQ